MFGLAVIRHLFSVDCFKPRIAGKMFQDVPHDDEVKFVIGEFVPVRINIIADDIDLFLLQYGLG